MTVLSKTIKPAKFNIKAFEDAFLKASKKMEKEMKKEFEITTIGWKTDVVFESLSSIGPNAVETLVLTDNKIYGYVNNGTVPHVIAAKNAKTLAFPWGGKGSYKAKTAPGKQVHNPGGGNVSGGKFVFPMAVQHPGTEARDFDKTIKKLMEPKYKRAMEAAMKEGAANSGHGVR
jgi:hypothetical protein